MRVFQNMLAAHAPNEKDAMMSRFLPRKEAGHVTSGDTGCLFLCLAGPVCADRIANCPLCKIY